MRSVWKNNRDVVSYKVIYPSSLMSFDGEYRYGKIIRKEVRRFNCMKFKKDRVGTLSLGKTMRRVKRFSLN